MRRTRLKKVLLLVIVFFMSSNFSFATAIEKENMEIITKNDFAFLSKSEVGLNEEFYIQLDLEKIEYSKFKVDIVSTLNLNVNEVLAEVKDITKKENVTSFTVNKEEITLDKIGIFYTSPKQNTAIKFSIVLTNLDNTKDALVNQLDLIGNDLKNYENKLQEFQDLLSQIIDHESVEYKDLENNIKEVKDEIIKKDNEIKEIQEKIENYKEETIEQQLTITVNAEKQEDEKDTSTDEKLNGDKNKPFGEKDSMSDKDSEFDIRKMMIEMSDLQGSLKEANNKINALTQGETYKGSQNNYLKSLNIDEGEFKNTFNKTMTTYFVRIDDKIDNINVHAVADDSKSSIVIYGNKNLKEGKNKILITVTAENGDVRYYKIFVSK